MVELIKIAIISPSAPPLKVGGVASAHYNLYRVLKGRGVCVKLFTFQDNCQFDSDCDDIIRCGTPKLLLRLVSLASTVFFKFLSGNRLACEMKDIAESALGTLKTNIFLWKFNPDVIVLPDHGAPGLFIFKLKTCKTILISHHNPARFLHDLFYRSQPDIKMALRIENRVLKKVHSVICPSEYMKSIFEKTYRFDGPVLVIPNLIDSRLIESITAFDIHKKLDLPYSAPIIYIPSAGSQLKGSQFVYEIVRRLSKSYGDWIGFYLSGDIGIPLRSELQYLPDNARIFMPGNVTYQENIALVKSCSFGVSPTLIENFGMAILEAMFCGIPMVSFDVGGNREIIIDGENGFIVPYIDLEELIIRAQTLLDSQFRQVIKEKTLNSIINNFNSDTIADDFLKLVSK